MRMRKHGSTDVVIKLGAKPTNIEATSDDPINYHVSWSVGDECFQVSIDPKTGVPQETIYQWKATTSLKKGVRLGKLVRTSSKIAARNFDEL